MTKNNIKHKKDWAEADYKIVVDKISITKQKVKQKEYLTKGKFPVIDQGANKIGGYTNDETKVLNNKLPLIVFGDHTKNVKLINFKFAPGADGVKILQPKINAQLLALFTEILTSKIINKGYARHYQFIEKSKIPIPPLPEQRSIVSKIEKLFSELDNGIDNLKKAQAQLKIYRQAVLKKAFDGEFTREWREQQTDLPLAKELLEQIKKEREVHYQKQLKDWESNVKNWEKIEKEGKKPIKPKKPKELPPLTNEELKELPKLPYGWIYNHLAHAGDLGRGKSKHRPRNDKILFGGKYPFFQTSEVKAQEIITNYTQTYNDIGLSQSKIWPKGTLCITIAANIAETGFLGIDACFPDSIVGFTPFKSIINSKYIDYFFHLAKTEISAWAPATAQKNINLTILENLVIPFCTLLEQHQIVQEIESRLSVCDKTEENIKENLKKAEALRQSILKKAFEGKLLTEAEINECKKQPEWEPAEELLRRIKAEKKEKA